MASRVDEVEAAMDSVVDNVATVEARLILQVALKLVIDITDDGLEAGIERLRKKLIIEERIQVNKRERENKTLYISFIS